MTIKPEDLTPVVHTLNSLEVHGRENLDRLLGCILRLEQLMKAANEEVENNDHS